MDSKLILEAARGTLDGSLSFPTGKGARASRLRFSASRRKFCSTDILAGEILVERESGATPDSATEVTGQLLAAYF
jgi:hypothetical protein